MAVIDIAPEDVRIIGESIERPIQDLVPVIQKNSMVVAEDVRILDKQAGLLIKFLRALKIMVDEIKENTQALENSATKTDDIAKSVTAGTEPEKKETQALAKSELDLLRKERETMLGLIDEKQAKLDMMTPKEARGKAGKQLKGEIDMRKEQVEVVERQIVASDNLVEEQEEATKATGAFSTELFQGIAEAASVLKLPFQIAEDLVIGIDKLTFGVFNLEEGMIKMKESVGEFLKGGLEKMKDGFVNSFKKMKESAGEFIKGGLEKMKDGFVKFAKGPLLTMAKTFGTLAKSILGVIAMNILAVLTNPYVLIGLAIAALVASIYIFRDELTEFFLVTIPEAFTNMIDAVANFFTETIPNFFKDLFDDIYMALPSFLGGASDEEEEAILAERERREQGMPSQAQFAEVARQREEELGGRGQQLVRSRVNEDMRTGRKRTMSAEKISTDMVANVEGAGAQANAVIAPTTTNTVNNTVNRKPEINNYDETSNKLLMA